MPPVPLAAISSQSRKKLKSFQFDAKLLDDGLDKENTPLEEPAPLPNSHDSPPRPSISHNAVPHTPAVKIPIEDLIANTEDAFNCPPPSATPKDHVLWQTHPQSSDDSSAARGTQQSRKRARSSSPASSQAGRSDQFSAQKEALNLDALQRSLRTPNNDPTQDLWNRYSTANASKARQAEPVLPAYSHLLPSSPQTPSTTGKDGSLRRTHSCGTEWPTSKPKRRRVATNEGAQGRTKEIFAASRKDILRHDLSNNTKVGLLLEKIQQSLTKAPRVEEGPSSSSPLPDRHSQALNSPTRPKSRLQPNFRTSPCKAGQPQLSPLRASCQQNDPCESSEFSDDGLDLEAFECLESAVMQKAEQNHPEGTDLHFIDSGQNSQRHAMQERDMVKQPLNIPPCSSKRSLHSPQKTSQAKKDIDNEFDDEDDEDLMNGMIDLVSKYDSQPGPTLGKPDIAAKQPATRLETLDEFEDAFDDDDDDMWDNIIGPGDTPVRTGMIKSSHPQVHTTENNSMDNRAIKRYLIVDVLQSEYEVKPGRKRFEKMLSVKDEKTNMLYVVLLRDSWYDTRCTKGSYVHIIGKFDKSYTCIVDDAANMIILHPDHLISSTVVGDSFTCMRRAVLQDRVKATSVATPPQVYGHILHEVFGQALLLDRWDAQSFREIIDSVLPAYLESIYEIGVRVQDATEYLLSKTPEMMAWACVFVGQDLSGDSVIRDRNGVLVPASINKVLELEEHIWSPMYGLKGNIDATVQAQMKLPGESTPRTLIVPFELKTGKKDNVEQHRVQTALYTLLLTDRYDINVTCGILYYMETSKTFRVEGIRNELRHMVIERNELACYVHDKLALPPMIKKEHMCKSCYSKAACFTYHKLSENGDGNTSGLGEKFNEMVNHLSPDHQTFFKKWDELLTKEERDTMKFRRELWTMLSSEREAVGRCFSEVMILPGSVVENHENSKINRFEYTFVKHGPRPGFSFLDSQITIGEPIVISDEEGHFNFAAGYVTNVRPNRVTVTVDRRLQYARRRRDGFDRDTNQVFSGTIRQGSNFSFNGGEDIDTPTLYRIDKDEFANGMATARNNLLRIMEKDLWRARELRQLIIEHKAPEFKVSSTAYVLNGPASQQNLNVDQRRAIEKVMSAKDYALVLGMPGTGKTTTIAHIIRALVSQGKSVLLASYTHTAVDNILLKIKDDKIPIFRIGAINKVHPDVKSFANISGIPKRSIEELEEAWHGSQVVATTCLGVNHGIFNARTFDYCIVDEASQITLPVCLGPIRMARTFILVGDHYQLPPLVQNKDAQEGGLDVSLFKLLSDAQPDSVVNLEHQYRMAEDIMLLSRELVYSGRIKCGNEAVANRLLNVPHLDAGLATHHFTASSLPQTSDHATPTICTFTAACWLRKAVAPTTRCLFLNTDSLAPAGIAREVAAGARVTNSTESTLTAQLVTALIHCGIPAQTIGVITFYRSQLALLRADVKSMVGSVAASDVEMHTADKYQGRDKEVIILSCVRSNDNNHVGDLLKDWRRVNVAVTRARSKLLILGSKSTLEGSGVPILQGLTKLMDGKGWIMDLPASAVDCHPFDTVQHTTNPTQFSVAVEKGLETAGTPQNSQQISKSTKRPLERSSGNTSHSPRKNAATGVHAPFKMPKKVVQGNKVLDVQRLLDKRPIMRDVMNEFDEQENIAPLQQMKKRSADAEFDMDAEFDPAAFGIF